MKLHVTQFSPASCCFLPLRPKYLSQHPVLDHLQPMFSLMLEIKFLTTEIMQNYSSVHVTLIFRSLHSKRQNKIFLTERRPAHTNCTIWTSNYGCNQIRKSNMPEACRVVENPVVLPLTNVDYFVAEFIWACVLHSCLRNNPSVEGCVTENQEAMSVTLCHNTSSFGTKCKWRNHKTKDKYRESIENAWSVPWQLTYGQQRKIILLMNAAIFCHELLRPTPSNTYL